MGNRNNILILLVIIFVSAFRIWGYVKGGFFKSVTGKQKGTYTVFLSSLLSIGLCSVCLFGATWAWFTSTVSAGVADIKSSSYSISVYKADGENPIDNGVVTVGDSGAVTLKLKATGTSGATGYCVVQIGENKYYTDQITVGDDEFFFTVNAQADTVIAITPQWGSCAVRNEDNKITNGGQVGQPIVSDRENTQNDLVDEPDGETTPTNPTDDTETPADSNTAPENPSDEVEETKDGEKTDESDGENEEAEPGEPQQPEEEPDEPETSADSDKTTGAPVHKDDENIRDDTALTTPAEENDSTNTTGDIARAEE